MKSIFSNNFETNPLLNSIYNNVTSFLFWQLYDEKSVKLAFWSRYEDTHTIGGIRQKLGSLSYPIVCENWQSFDTSWFEGDIGAQWDLFATLQGVASFLA